MRICLYTFQFPEYLGGVSTYTYLLYKNLVKKGHEVHIVTRIHPKNIHVSGLHESKMIPIPFLHYISNAIDSYAIIEKIRPDIIHAQHGGPGLLLKKTQYPQLLTIHSLSEVFKHYYQWTSKYGFFIRSGAPVLKFLERRNFKLANQIHVLFNQCKNDMQKYYKIDLKDAPVIPNGVDLDYYNPKHKDDSIIEKYGKIVLFSGTNDERKGIPELIKIIAHFNRNYDRKGVSFVITGDGPLNTSLRQFAARFSNVYVLGYVSNDLLQRLCASARVFLFPTRIEAFPFSLLEALSSGIPIITSPVGGIPDLFSHQTDIGLCTLPTNTAVIAQYLERLVIDDDLCSNLGKNGRALVKKKYDWSLICNRIVNQYEKLL